MRHIFFSAMIISLLITFGCGSDKNNPITSSTKGTITGKITDQNSGNIISGASINTQPTTTTVTSDNVGNYTITDVEAGNYSLIVTMSGYVSNTSNVGVTADQNSVVNISLSPTPTPDPIASFNYGGSMITPAVITFQNTSQNADSYLWAFGDGTTSTTANPSKTYNTKGTYIVKLTASNIASGKSNQISQDIIIKPSKVFLQKVTVDAFPSTNGNGASWDIASWPDVLFTVSDSVYILNSASTYFNDLDPADLPVQWTLSTEYQFQNWNKTYYIDLWDYDSFSSNEYMGATNGFKINQLVTYPTTLQLQNTSGTIKVKLTLKWQ